jgi:hypothetical protein
MGGSVSGRGLTGTSEIGWMVGPGFGFGNLRPPEAVPEREKTAMAQSAIAQLEVCDLFFMGRTLIDWKSCDNRRRVT